MTKPYVVHEDATIESFKQDPEYAAEYLNAVLDDGTQEELMLALRRIATAYGMIPPARPCPGAGTAAGIVGHFSAPGRRAGGKGFE